MSGEISPVEKYLSELFDELAGLGVAGHRLLVETEDHLRCGVVEMETAGMDRTVAERRAVERMGSAADIAAQLRVAVLVPWKTVLARFVGAAWVIGVVAFLSLGASGVLAFGAAQLWGRSAIVSDAPDAPIAAARCQYYLEYYPQPDGSCWQASVAHHYEEELRNRLAAGIIGAVGAAAYVAVRRSRRLRRLRPLTALPPMSVVGAIASTLFGLTAVIVIGQGIDDFAIGRPWGAWASIVSGIALVPAALWFARRTLFDVRRTRGPFPTTVAAT